MQQRLYQFLPLLILLGGVTAGGLAQSPAPDTGGTGEDGSTNLLSRFSLLPQKKNEEKQDSASSKGKPASGTLGIKQTELAAQIQAREREAYFRREAVCDKLRQIADKMNDRSRAEKLEQMAAQLLQLAGEVHDRRISQWTGSTSGAADEKLLQSKLVTGPTGTNGAASPRASAPTDSGATYTISGGE